MHTMAFDTLRYANKLKSAGVPEQQAEIQASILAEVIEEKLLTKQDLELTQKDIKNEFHIKMAELKTDLIKWVLGISVAQATILLSCLKFFH